MGRFPGLTRRGNSYGVRVRVPAELRPILKRREIVKSFGAVSHSAAVRKLEFQKVAIRRLFDDARLKLTQGDSPVPVDIDPLVRGFLVELERERPPVPIDGDEQDRLREAIADEASYIGRPYGPSDPAFQARVRRYITGAGLAVPEGIEFFRVCCRMVDAEIEHLQRCLERVTPGVAESTTINPGFAGVGENASTSQGLTLTEAIRLFKASPRRQGRSAATRRTYGFRLRVLEELVGGDKLVASITRADMNRYRDKLLELPERASQRFPGMSALAAIEANRARGLPTLSAKSIRLYVEQTASLFKWLDQEDHVPRNVARGLESPDVPKSTRRPLTPNEINALMRATSEKARGGKDWAFWTARISFLHGLRIGEPVGLRSDDVLNVNGIWALRLASNETRALKTEHSERLVPVHPALIHAGLLDLKDGSAANKPLLPNIPPSIGAAQRSMMRIFRPVVGDDPDAVFHSLRHNMRDAMREADVPLDVAARLGGWKVDGSDAMEGYGAGHSLSKLAEWMERISYRGIDLS